MKETEWVESVIPGLRARLTSQDPTLRINSAQSLPYAFEVRTYDGGSVNDHHSQTYQTDLLVAEVREDGLWTPRVVIEAKLGSVTTHDAITYSQKAVTHKTVHPYLRYGILLGNRKHYPLPGRLFRHGLHFDFMASWCGLSPEENELSSLGEVVLAEVMASRSLEEIIYDSRRRDRRHFTLLHRPLSLS